MIVLTLQSTPTDLRYDLWDMVGERGLVEGVLEDIGPGTRHDYRYAFGSGRGTASAGNVQEAFARVWETLEIAMPSIERVDGIRSDIACVGHLVPFRVPGHDRSFRLDADAIRSLEEAARPSGGHSSVDVVREALRVLPTSRHVGVFDDLSLLASNGEIACYAVRPPWMGDVLVHRLRGGATRLMSVVDPALDMLSPSEGSRRIIVCDLDRVVQVSAFKGRTLIETTHECDGSSRIVSETAPGAVTPGLRTALLQAGAPDAISVDALLKNGSGLSCLEDEPRTLQDLASMAADNIYGSASRMLFDQIVREIGGQVTLLGGLDALVFTGRCGERSPALRSLLATRLRILRLAIDERLNEMKPPAREITLEGVRIRVFVLPARPAWHMALETVLAVDDGG